MKLNKSTSLLLTSVFLFGMQVNVKAADRAPVDTNGSIMREVHRDVSPPLRQLAGMEPTAHRLTEQPLRLIPGQAANGPDAALQTTANTPSLSASGILGFPGVGQNDYNFTVSYAPPDTTGAVGETQYVQWVYTAFAVFNKTTGALQLGPLPGNNLWAGFGGGCQTKNDGDPIVQYDKLAKRWVLTQFSVSTTPYLQCVAVSTTSDATGSYYRYAFSYGSKFNDYPKMGIWPDGYYMTYNIFSGNTFAGALVCAFERSSMIVGSAASQQCFQTSSLYGGLLPSDLDGINAPPQGSPNYVMSYGTNSLNLWKFRVDWANPGNSTFGVDSTPPTIATFGSAGAPVSIPVATFAIPCSGGGACIPQPSTTQKLDSLADRLMYRLSYRNFGTYESLLVNHSVTAGKSVGIRWYEVQNPNGTPIVKQQGTYAPDSAFRWMGSIAQDKKGNIAVGYSKSSSNVYPSIFYTARAFGDPLNTMRTETQIIAGSGSQLRTLSRWGDYSSMTIDPEDDCTFWFTSEYLKISGTFNWSTYITSFRLPGCLDTTYTISSASASPTGASVPTGYSSPATQTSITLNRSGTGGSAPTATLSVTGGAWTIGSLSGVGAAPTLVSSSSPSTLMLNATTGTFNLSLNTGSLAGTYTATITSGGTTLLTYTVTVTGKKK